jgi:hypothetical protein
MKKSEAYEMGFERGESVASWIDIPELGTEIKHIDYVGYETVTEENFLDVMEMFAFEAESNGREYSPFEFTASEFNKARNSESLWEAFDNGIADGIRKEM